MIFEHVKLRIQTKNTVLLRKKKSDSKRLCIRTTCLLILLTVTSSSLHAQYSGKVFEDSNWNGVYDKGEKQLANVAVSDGLHVVQTDSKGNYQLPGHERMRFLFITTPSGYKTFNAFYQRVVERADSYDFAVYPCRERIQSDGSHRFIHLSDTEISTKDGNEIWSRQLCEYADNEKIAFIVHTGDICYEGGLKNHIRILNTQLTENTQVFYGIGNHDLVKGVYGEELYEKLYGPVYYSFDVGAVHYVMTPMLYGDYRPGYNKEDVYRWLKNDLALVKKDKPIVVFNHSIPEDTITFRYGISPTKYIDLLAMGVKHWLYGHWHIHHHTKHSPTGMNLICTATPASGGIDHATSAFRVLKIDGKGEMTSEMRYSYFPAYVQIASFNGKQIPRLSSGKIPLTINAYSSVSSVQSVKYRCLCEGQPITPYRFLESRSDFTWYTEITLSPKWNQRKVTVEVLATFKNGEVKATKRSFFNNSLNCAFERQLSSEPCSLTSHPANDYLSTNTFLLAEPVRLSWVQNVGASVYMTTPIIQDAKVYVATIDDNNSGKSALLCLDARSGDLCWKYATGGSVRSSIAVTDGQVLAQDVFGTLYCVNALTGKLTWTRDLGVGMLPGLNDGLTAVNGVVYAGTGQSLCALKVSDGKLLWRNNEWSRGEGCVATLSLHKNILIGHANWKGLYANNAETGKMLWEKKGKELRFRSGSVTWVGNQFYLLSGRSLFLIDGQSGNILLQKSLGYGVDVNTAPLVTDEEIIFGTTQRGVVALHKETLKEKWQFKTSPALICTAPYTGPASSTVETRPVLLGDSVYFGASDGWIYALDRKNGQPVWKFQTGVPIFSTVAIADGWLYVADYGGNVYGFEL